MATLVPNDDRDSKPRESDQRRSRRRRADASVIAAANESPPVSALLADVSGAGARIIVPATDAAPFVEGARVSLRPASDRAGTLEVRDGEIVWRRSCAQDGVECGIRLHGPAAVSLDPLDIDRVKIDAVLALRLPAGRATRWQVLPFAQDGERVLVAAASVPPPRTLSAIQRLYGLPPEVHLAEADRLAVAMDRIYSGAAEMRGGAGLRGAASIDWDASIDRGASIDIESRESDEADAASLCDRLLMAAAVENASDIHIDTYESETRIRFRIDGQLQDVRSVKPEHGAALISRIKVLAGLDISERRAPQDGRMRHDHGSTPIDIRVASLPAKQGERLTLRLLARDAGRLTLPKLGMSSMQLGHFNEAIRKPHGMVLITGPTGSGKSTTLYAAIRQLIDETMLNVITIEDPVEYQIDGITQVEVDQREKVTFAKALRSTLRHDPDVVMVGEIRDGETADIAVKAALTGHLVFSTLHTNDAVGAITRLRDMGVPLYLVSATLRLVMAQRLVRRLCDRCSIATTCLEGEAAAIDRPDLEGQAVFGPSGCMYCGGQGYSGRLALFEALPNDADLARLIAEGADEAALAGHMRKEALPTLGDDAADRLLAGHTSLAEVLRNVMSHG
jgi:type IV pilus assembly protein PilB